MPTAIQFVRTLSSESNVDQRHCKRVLEALGKCVTSGLKEKGVVKIPNLVEVRKKVVKAKPARAVKVFGRVIQADPKPASLRFQAKVAKKLTDRLLAALPPVERQ